MSDEPHARKPAPVGPLAHLAGAVPAPPPWFEKALADEPERGFHEVQGAKIETLAWGRIGAPGLLLMHGNGAHADWYRFIAPFFAADHRVVALSWSGMGNSDWRDSYTLDVYVEEALQVAQATGLFDAAVEPMFVGHSFGSFITLACAARAGDRLRAAVAVDLPLLTHDEREARKAARANRGDRSDGPPRRGMPKPYPSLEAALARFRLMPVQECEHLYIVDYIARHSLKHVTDAEGDRWQWKFAPNLFDGYRASNPEKDIAAARCPIALMRGDRSQLVSDATWAYTRSVVPAGTPMIDIPDADHHLMLDQPLAFVAALRGLTAGWP